METIFIKVLAISLITIFTTVIVKLLYTTGATTFKQIEESDKVAYKIMFVSLACAFVSIIGLVIMA